jgi:hypothetical protein
VRAAVKMQFEYLKFNELLSMYQKQLIARQLHLWIPGFRRGMAQLSSRFSMGLQNWRARKLLVQLFDDLHRLLRMAR